MWKKIIINLLMAVLLGMCSLQGIAAAGQASLQKGIASGVIRFHVLADSDAKEAQQAKLQVKDRIVSYLDPLLRDADSAEECCSRIRSHLRVIEGKSRQTLEEQGISCAVSAGLKRAWFPEKTYGDCTFPAGFYEALQIRIGSASGRNWWCVLYPGLCFENSLKGVVTDEGKEKLARVLTEEEMACVMDQGKVKIRFRWFS